MYLITKQHKFSRSSLSFLIPITTNFRHSRVQVLRNRPSTLSLSNVCCTKTSSPPSISQFSITPLTHLSVASLPHLLRVPLPSPIWLTLRRQHVFPSFPPSCCKQTRTKPIWQRTQLLSVNKCSATSIECNAPSQATFSTCHHTKLAQLFCQEAPGSK